MKNFGSVCEFARQRTADLLRVYFACIESCAYVRMPEIFESVVNSPAPRFYISAPRAAVVVAALDKGDSLSSMRPNKREMFAEIYRRYLILRAANPAAPVAHLVRDIVEQPAPKFYLSASSAKIIILKARKLWFKEKSKKMQLFSSRLS